ncbi:MAG: tetratricopeptide repeat protein [Acidobacteria bacterium]|nr:tetratricopeptide repeat protein [Acidobacteriota bacterium]
MKRLVLAIVGLSAAVAAVSLLTAFKREHDYRRLIEDGEAALRADQPFVAIEAFSGAIALKRDSMLAYLKRGETYRRRGELPSALRDLRTAADLDPTATRPLEELGDINYGLARYGRAAERYADYVRLDERSTRVLYKLALSHFRAGNVAQAVAALHRAIRLNDRFAEAFYLLGLCHRDQDRFDEARRSFERAIEISPGFVEPRDALASVHEAVGAMAEQIDQLEALAALEPSRPERQVALGSAYARAGRTDLAVLTLGRAAERHPEQPQLYVALGRVWLDAAETRDDRVALSKALEALQGPVAGTGATSEALTLLGRALLLAGDLELAERMLQQASERFPVDPDSFRYFADAAEQRGHIAPARQALIKLAVLTGDTAPSAVRAARTVRIALLSLRLRDGAAAQLWLRRGSDVADTAPLLASVAEQQLHAGDREGARATIVRGLAKDPQYRALTDLQHRLTKPPRAPSSTPPPAPAIRPPPS